MSSATASVTGVGAPTGKLTASAASLSFSVPAIGDTSAAQTVTFTNSGGGPLVLYAASQQFPISLGFTEVSNTCAPPSLAAGASCAVIIASTPGSNSTTGVFEMPWSGDGVHMVDINVSLSTTVTGLVNGLVFMPITPCRVVETRDLVNAFGGPEIAGNTSRTFTLPAGNCNIPANAAAYSLNVTAAPDAALGYLSVWPAGETMPDVSTLNSDGRVKANAAIVSAGVSGAISVYASDATNVVLDINGYFVPYAGTGLVFYPLTPCRVADTRNPTGYLGAPSLSGGVNRDFPILSSNCGIPATAQAYSLNFTAVPDGPLGYLTAWPAGSPLPLASTLNASIPDVTSNAAIVPAGTNGDISVFASNNTDLVIDINGYFAPPIPGGLVYYPIIPCRALDTRDSHSPQPVAGILDANIVASNCNVPISAQALVLNATVVPQTILDYLTLWSQGQPQPLVSTLNSSGVVVSNMAIVPTDNGSISAFTTQFTQLILDVSGYFGPSTLLGR